jgi:hypothetical protein
MFWMNKEQGARVAQDLGGRWCGEWIMGGMCRGTRTDADEYISIYLHGRLVSTGVAE